MSIAVLGAGAFGTALALSLAREGHEICIWARDAATVDATDSDDESGDDDASGEPPVSPDAIEIVLGDHVEEVAAFAVVVATKFHHVADFLQNCVLERPVAGLPA